MKIIAWNCQGLGNTLAVSGLLKCQKSEEADILFLFETKMEERKMETIRLKVGMANMEVVDCERWGACSVMAEWSRFGMSKQIKIPY
jgi:exonuclease III